jgi:hypothetical protein
MAIIQPIQRLEKLQGLPGAYCRKIVRRMDENTVLAMPFNGENKGSNPLAAPQSLKMRTTGAPQRYDAAAGQRALR